MVNCSFVRHSGDDALADEVLVALRCSGGRDVMAMEASRPIRLRKPANSQASMP